LRALLSKRERQSLNNQVHWGEWSKSGGLSKYRISSRNFIRWNDISLFLVWLQDAQLFPNVATDFALTFWSNWQWPWTSPMKYTWWQMENLEHRKE